MSVNEEKRNIIVIGASSGGFNAIKQLVAALPGTLNASIFIVWHMSPDLQGILPQVLNRDTKLPASNAFDKCPIESGHIYVAVPDHHLLVVENEMRVTKGPKENHFRPAVDPLFRSAALAFGARVIGVVLSGALDDGAAGLWAIKANGGVTIVQDPSTAEVPSMPQNAILAAKPDYVVPVSTMADLLAKLTEETPANSKLPTSQKDDERNKLEVDIAMNNSKSIDILDFAAPTHYTCPECHGVLMAIRENERVRFRCHTGHAFSPDTLLSLLTGYIEDGLWNVIRSMQESILLLNHVGDHFAEINQPKLAAIYFNKAKEAELRILCLRDTVAGHEQLTHDGLRKIAGPEETAEHRSTQP